jgi:signal transduction histidine kinase
MDAQAIANVVLQTIPAGVIALDQHEQITLITPAAAQLLDLDAGSWLGQPFAALRHALSLPDILGQQLTFVQGARSTWVLQVLIPPEKVRSADAHTLLLVEQTTLRERGIQYVISSLTHEFRAPLTAIQGYTRILLHEPSFSLSSDQRNFVEIIGHHVTTLSAIVQDTLLGYNIAVGNLVIDRQPWQFADLVTKVLQQPAGRGARLSALELHIPDALPPVFVDHWLCESLVDQLLAWAGQQTQNEGPVQLTALSEESMLVANVTHRGRSLRAEERSHIETLFGTPHVIPFSPDFWVNGYLFLAHQLTVLNNGTLALIDTTDGYGVQLRLPLAPATEEGA